MISVRTGLRTSAVVLAIVAVGLALMITFVAHGQPALTVKTAVKAAPTKAVVKAPAKAPATQALAHAALLKAAPAARAPATQQAVAAVAPAPASQPAIKVPAGFWPWLTANGSWFVPLLIFVLSSLATVLSKYPRAKGLIAALRMFMGGLSMLEFKDGRRPGMVLKWPATLPAPPPNSSAPPDGQAG